MSELSIRVTYRTEIDGRSIEKTIDIETIPAAPAIGQIAQAESTAQRVPVLTHHELVALDVIHCNPDTPAAALQLSTATCTRLTLLGLIRPLRKKSGSHILYFYEITDSGRAHMHDVEQPEATGNSPIVERSYVAAGASNSPADKEIPA